MAAAKIKSALIAFQPPYMFEKKTVWTRDTWQLLSKEIVWFVWLRHPH